MKRKPGALIPLSEVEWIIGTFQLVYPGIVDQMEELKRDPLHEITYRRELVSLRQQEREVLKSMELLQGRIRECVTGETPAPPHGDYVYDP